MVCIWFSLWPGVCWAIDTFAVRIYAFMNPHTHVMI